MQTLPAALSVAGAGVIAAGAKGFGVELDSGIETWPVICAGLLSLIGGIGTQVSQFKTAALAPPVNPAGEATSAYTISIALGQAYREKNQKLVKALADTLETVDASAK